MAIQNPTVLPVEPVFLDTKAAATSSCDSSRERWTTRRWAGRRPQFRRHGGRVVYAVADLLAWSEAQVRVSTSDPGSAQQGGAKKKVSS